MGNTSYNLHKACPSEHARYHHCYVLFFENRIIPPPPQVTAADPNDPRQVAEAAEKSRRRIYRNGEEVTDPGDVQLALGAIDPGHLNYACRDLWEDYKECVNRAMDEKQADYLRRRAEKEKQQQQQQQATQQEAKK